MDRSKVISPRLFAEPPSCYGVNHVVEFFTAFELFFFVLLVDCEEWFCSLAGSFPGARLAIVCILFSLEQSQVVDSSGCKSPSATSSPSGSLRLLPHCGSTPSSTSGSPSSHENPTSHKLYTATTFGLLRLSRRRLAPQIFLGRFK